MSFISADLVVMQQIEERRNQILQRRKERFAPKPKEITHESCHLKFLSRWTEHFGITVSVPSSRFR